MRKFFLIIGLLFTIVALTACTAQKPIKTDVPTILVRPNPRYIDYTRACVDGDSLRVRLADEKPICRVTNQAYKQAYMEIHKNGRFLTKIMHDLEGTLVVGDYEVLLRDRRSGEVLSRVKIDCYI